MHVIVVGCGRVGSELVLTLARDGHSVAVIDKDRNALQRLPETWRGQKVEGFGFDRDHLQEAGIGECGAFAAVRSGDNSNILSARIARETYRIPNVAARIYDPRRAVIYQRLGISTVASVAWATEQVMRRLFPHSSAIEWTDPTGTMCLVERDLPPGWAGKKLSGLDGDLCRVVSLTRAGSARLPGPSLVGQEGDVLHVLVPKARLEEAEAHLAGGGREGQR